MKKILTRILIICGLLLALIIFKPSKDNFRKHIEEKYEEFNDEDSFKNVVNKTVSNFGTAAINAQSQISVDYSDQFLFATASTKKKYETNNYLGILGFWIKLS